MDTGARGVDPPMRFPVVYIAGPFRGSTAWAIEENVRLVERTALALWQLGVVVPLAPHTMCRFYQGAAPDSVFIQGTLELLRRCDAVLLVGEWRQSTGTLGEVAEAERSGTPVFETIPELVDWATGKSGLDWLVSQARAKAAVMEVPDDD